MAYGNNFKSLAEDNHYKYLDILQADSIKHTEVMKIRSEYNNENEEDLSVQPIVGNSIKVINTWAMSHNTFTSCQTVEEKRALPEYVKLVMKH